ncbi:MAG: hypothetical protein QXH20_02605 [Candidatus Bathyarchaeia archaeon]
MPTKPHEHARSWLPAKLDRRELKALAEKSALENAVQRTERRKDLMIETDLLYAYVKEEDKLK